MIKLTSKSSKYILAFLFLSISVNIYPFAGLYIAPKLSFYPYLPEYKTTDNSKYDFSMGYSLSLGYDFSKLKTNTPFRVDIEYTGNISFTQKRFRIDYLFLSGYYDIHFYKKNRQDNFDDNYVNAPICSLYIGAGLGLSVITEDTGVWYEKNTLVSVSSHTYRKNFVIGIDAGLILHIRNYMALDLGYKWIVSPLIKDSHNALIGLRFTIPRFI